MTELPQEICAQCQSEAPDHWLTDLWYYCPHNLVMVRRRRKTDQWTIDRRVKPKHASKAPRSLEEADAMVTRLREIDRS